MPEGGDPHGGAINSWAPPPVAPQQTYQPPMQQSAPTGMSGPATGQYQTPDWQGGPPQTQQPGQPQQQPFVPQHMPQPGQPGHSVNDLNLLKRARKAPRSGWRRAVHKASRGIINPGESAADVVHADLVERVNQPVRGDYRIAILSLKGGVGKTTTTVGIGSTFASLRGDRVIAIDANPDLGTLAHRVPRQTRSTVRNLLEDQHITRYSDVRAHTSQAPSRLEVLASEQDPAVSEAFSEADYRKAIGILQSFYNIILTDCGTGLMHSAMAGVLDMASSLVLVTSPPSTAPAAPRPPSTGSTTTATASWWNEPSWWSTPLAAAPPRSISTSYASCSSTAPARCRWCRSTTTSPKARKSTWNW